MMKLDQEQITAAALELLQAEGLDGLSMRALAAHLGVRVSALYWHIADKDQLYALMVRHFYRTSYMRADKASTAREWLTILGREFRLVLLDYHDSARLCAIAPPVAADSREKSIDLTARLVELGMVAHPALTAIASILAFTLGWVVYEQSPSMHDHLAGMIDLEQTFLAGLESIVNGLMHNASVKVASW